MIAPVPVHCFSITSILINALIKSVLMCISFNSQVIIPRMTDPNHNSLITSNNKAFVFICRWKLRISWSTYLNDFDDNLLLSI